MLKNNISKFIAVFAIMAIITPSFALAHGGNDDDNNRDRSGKFEQKFNSTNEFGVHVLGENKRNADRNADRNDDRGIKQYNNKNYFANLFYSGEVTAVSSTGFTIKTNNNTTFNVNTESAKIIRIPRDVINLSEIQVGDTVHVTGTKDEGVITASVVYNMAQNLKPAIAKGTVTAVSDNSITLATKDNQTVTLNTDGDTRIVDKDGEVSANADIEIGTKVKSFGLWDTVLNVFNTIKVKLF